MVRYNCYNHGLPVTTKFKKPVETRRSRHFRRQEQVTTFEISHTQVSLKSFTVLTFRSPRCQEGSLLCQKEACPVLNCPERYVDAADQCCPVCRGSRKVFDLRMRACLFNNRVYDNNTSIAPDKCTTCACLVSSGWCNVSYNTVGSQKRSQF